MSAQQIELSFPALQGKAVNIYYYKGSRPDTLMFSLDKHGSGKTRLPDGYKGFIQVDVSDSGIIKCIGGEPLLKIESSKATIDKEQVNFPDSPENSFLYRIFKEKSLNINRSSWLQFGKQLYDPQSDIYQLLEKENKINEERTSSIAKEIEKSDLYASKLIGFMDYINELGAAIDTQDTLSLPKLKKYFHTEMDWQVLYTSGEFWRLVNEYYTGLFEQFPLGKKEKESRYVEDISPLFGQLQEPVRSAFLEITYETCERLGWDTAKSQILSYIFENNIEIDAQNANLRRIMSAQKTKQGKPAPPVKGLTGSLSDGITLVLFYDSGCDNCVVQLEELKKQYVRLHNSGVRVVSVSADADDRTFSYLSKSFPWQDKLCDYKGFMGENFINYAILATPTFFVIANGTLVGRYASLSDTGLL
jgi:hypothetical protein